MKIKMRWFEEKEGRKINKARVLFRKAPIPILLSFFSLLFFLYFYSQAVFQSVRQFYLLGLGFSLPFISFGMVTLLTVKERVKKERANKISLLLAFILAFLMLLLMIAISFITAVTNKDEPKEYKRILKVTGYPDNSLISDFPALIPDNAGDITFHYNPRFLQGGEVWILDYKTDMTELVTREEKYRRKAVWTGKISDSSAFEKGISFCDFSHAGYNALPEDFNIYLFYSKPYKEGNWNHGCISLAAVSPDRKELLFYAEDW